MKRVALAISAVCIIGAVSFWGLTAPNKINAERLPEHQADVVNGETLFWAGGCASCHAAETAEGEEKLILSGGYQIASPFGVFIAPNISPHENGIGDWSDADFINAMAYGVSPSGKHYYPAFPYNYYQRMTFTDLIDLKAFLDTLPKSDAPNQQHQLSFPFTIRRGLGLWKRRYVDGATFQPIKDATFEINRGRYLVDAVSHCGACHTPRDALGGEIVEQYMQGAATYELDNTSGELKEGWVPNITSSEDGLADWSADDIAYSLESGFTPEFDSFGGSMASVQANTAKLTAEDRLAIARYLKTIK